MMSAICSVGATTFRSSRNALSPAISAFRRTRITLGHLDLFAHPAISAATEYERGCELVRMFG